MKTLMLEVPESVYNDALAFSPDEQVRLIAAAFRAAHEAATYLASETSAQHQTEQDEEEAMTEEEREAEMRLYAGIEANGIPRLQL